MEYWSDGSDRMTCYEATLEDHRIAFSGSCHVTQADSSVTRRKSRRRRPLDRIPPVSLFYSVASGLAKVISGAGPMQAVVQPYTGSSTFLPLFDSGEIDFGIVNAVDMGLAYQGQRLKIGGKNPLPHSPNTRLIMRGSPLLTSLVAKKDASGENRRRCQRQTRDRRISGPSRRLVQRLRLLSPPAA